MSGTMKPPNNIGWGAVLVIAALMAGIAAFIWQFNLHHHYHDSKPTPAFSASGTGSCWGCE